MPSYPLRALVLRKTKLGETDLILTLLAADGRQVRAVAKGARKPKSKLGARAEPFTVLDALLHTGRSLEILAEAETLSAHAGLRADYDKCCAASALADVLDKLSVEGQAEPHLFEMSLVTLDVLETCAAGAEPAVLAAFLLKALSMHGYRPSLDACAGCGGAISTVSAFSIESGGFVCDACTDAGSMTVSADAAAYLRALMRARLSEVPAIAVEPATVSEVLRVLRAYAAFHVPARLRALDSFVGAL